MTKQEQEERILRLAIEKGLITDQELPEQEREVSRARTVARRPPRWGQRIDMLVRNGKLSEAIVEALAKEVKNVSENHLAPTDQKVDGTVNMDLDRPDWKVNSDTITDTFGPVQAESSAITVERFAPIQLPQNPRAFPVENWDRYEFLEFIGEGGMGQVYKAKDLRLNRYVALKFIRGQDPEMLHRFSQEAQAQARIKHGNICKVYEVGEVEGNPYIAMQYIDGQSLKEAAKKMNLEQKAEVMKEVCEALHAAHRLGLIHRDIKPANIMVEQSEEGIWQPYVMDFGLVREIEAEGQTATGAVMGTPSYMSPEQARGEIHHLDRRSDIYSLGATLYALLAGRAPFVGTTGMAVVLKLINDEPEPVRKLDASIPPDLETIVMKCLEKEPQQRYESAKALADELQRYLDGEPIKARRASWGYWAAKKAKKHKAVVGISAVALVLVMALGGMGLQARWTAVEQARLAQKFGEQVQKIEGIMRYGRMLPLHDIGREEEMVHQQMQEIAGKMKDLGETAQGPGHYALGRGYAALAQFSRAKDELEQAWAKGYHEPQAAYVLGLVLGRLYQDRLAEIKVIENREYQRREKQKIEVELKLPALKYLEIGRGAEGESSEYVEALLAFYDRRWEEALKKAEMAQKKIPWLFEARALAGRVYVEIGDEKYDKGYYEEAKRAYDKAQSAYEDALKIGPSDANTYENHCNVLSKIIELDLAVGRPLHEDFDRAIRMCDLGIEANSREKAFYNVKSNLYGFLGDYKFMRGEDPSKEYESSIEEAKKSIAIKPTEISCANLGVTYKSLAEYQVSRGGDPSAIIDKSIESYRKAIQLNPNYAISYNNLGNVYMAKVDYKLNHGENPLATTDLGIECYRKAIQIDPNFSLAYMDMAVAYIYRGEYQLNASEEPTVALNQSIENSRKSLQLNPNNYVPYLNLAEAYWAKGKYQVSQGQDPTDTLQQAIASARSARSTNPNEATSYENEALAYLVMAQWDTRHNLSPEAAFNNSREALRKATEINANNANLYRVLGEWHRLRAEWLLKDGRQGTNEAKKEIKNGLAAVEKALSNKADLAEAYLTQGALYLLKAQIEPGGQIRIAEQARSAFQKALSINRLLEQESLRLLKMLESRTKRGLKKKSVEIRIENGFFRA